MHFLFLNQFFPPDPAPTGVLLHELAAELEQAGHTVAFVAARQTYRAGQRQGGRMRRELAALGRMLLDGWRSRRAEVVISASSPPCLLVVATLIAWWHRARSVHWIMDLYPEIAVALGEVRAGPVARGISWLMGWGYRQAAQVVVLDEDMAVRLRAYGVAAAIIRPWVFTSVQQQLATARATPDAEWTWIYSGNLGRAHEWETLLQTQRLLEARGAGVRLLFQGGGPAWPAAQSRAAELGLRQVVWRDYVEEAELPNSLLRCHVLVVTELPAVQGLLWPSKLGLVLSLPRPIVFIGPVDGAIARLLREFPHTGFFAPGQAEQIADWLLARQAESGQFPASAIFDPQAQRRAALAAWQTLLTTNLETTPLAPAKLASPNLQ